MGVELRITRAELWSENDGKEITSEEWLRYVESDPELRLRPENGRCYALWSGASKYEEPWLNWFQGNINTKWPDSALYHKMLQIAIALNAHVQDDDGNVYQRDIDWQFDPIEHPIPAHNKVSPWARIKRFFGK